jgi:hypothetical protein
VNPAVSTDLIDRLIASARGPRPSVSPTAPTCLRHRCTPWPAGAESGLIIRLLRLR